MEFEDMKLVRGLEESPISSINFLFFCISLPLLPFPFAKL